MREVGGSAPGWGGLKRLPARVGMARAKEMLFNGVRLDAQRALHVVADEWRVALPGTRIASIARWLEQLA